MKFKCAQFFSKKVPLKKPATTEVMATTIDENSSFTVPHRIHRIDIINIQNRTVILLLTPYLQSNDILDLCRSIKQDFDLFGDDSDDNKKDPIMPIELEAKENFCVLVTTQHQDNFLHLLRNAKAITEEEERQILSNIKNTIISPHC